MAAKFITFTLNGRERDVMVRPLTTLQKLLREELGYTATKSGCKQGGCGSCTVLLDGDPVPSCLLPVEDVAGREVTTLEGLSPDQALHPLQQAFLDKNGSEQEVSEALTGNYCRCTGYGPIIEAVQSVAEEMNGHKGG